MEGSGKYEDTKKEKLPTLVSGKYSNTTLKDDLLNVNGLEDDYPEVFILYSKQHFLTPSLNTVGNLTEKVVETTQDRSVMPLTYSIICLTIIPNINYNHSYLFIPQLFILYKIH